MSRRHRPLIPRFLVAALAVPALLAGTASATTITVDTVSDNDAPDGVCSLREAILAANSDAVHNDCAAGDGADRIVFALGGPATVQIDSDLPTITETVLISGPGPQQLAIDGQDAWRPLHFDTAGGGWLGVERLTVARGFSPAGEHGGGAAIGAGETAWFRRVRFIANRSLGGGGAVDVGSSTAEPTSATFVECLIEDNVAEGIAGGGGVLSLGGGAGLTVVRSTFVDNAVEVDGLSGGALRALDATLVIESSTFSGNRTEASGGAIQVHWTAAGGSLAVRNSTITLNTANADNDPSGDAGGISVTSDFATEATFELTNSVVAGNSDLGGTTVSPDLQCSSFIQLAASGTSFVGANEDCTGLFPEGFPNAGGDYVGTAAAPIDPLLLPLDDYGGPLPTHLPAFGAFSELGVSALIDRGHCPDDGTDQRGFGDGEAATRRVDIGEFPNGAGSDGCDIGAVEVGGEPGTDPTIFADGFEDGHTLLWTSEVP